MRAANRGAVWQYRVQDERYKARLVTCGIFVPLLLFACGTKGVNGANVILAPASHPAVSVFTAFISRAPERHRALPLLGPAAIFSFLSKCNIGYRDVRVDALVFGDKSYPYDDDVAFLRSVRPGVSIDFHMYDHPLEWVATSPVLERGFADMNFPGDWKKQVGLMSMLTRFMFPLVSKAQWYFVFDVDVQFYGDFLAAALQMAQADPEAVLWASQDTALRNWPNADLHRYVESSFAAAGHPELGLSAYFNCGLLLLRGGAALERELGKWRSYMGNRGNRDYLLEQNALNFAVNRSLVRLWPYCTMSMAWGCKRGNATLAYHNINPDKVRGAWPALGSKYLAARARWLQNREYSVQHGK